MNAESNTNAGKQTLGGLAARVLWLMLGPLALPLAAGHIAVNEAGAYTAADWVFLGLASAMILARLLDVTKLGGSTAQGGSATMTDFVRYALLVAVAAAALWAAAHWIGPLIA